MVLLSHYNDYAEITVEFPFKKKPSLHIDSKSVSIKTLFCDRFYEMLNSWKKSTRTGTHEEQRSSMCHDYMFKIVKVVN